MSSQAINETQHQLPHHTQVIYKLTETSDPPIWNKQNINTYSKMPKSYISTSTLLNFILSLYFAI